MKASKCMFTHSICIKEECKLYLNIPDEEEKCLFQEMCIKIVLHLIQRDPTTRKRDFFEYCHTTFHGENREYEMILDITKGRDILNTKAIDILLDFVSDNNFFEHEEEVFNYDKEVNYLLIALFVYKNAIRKFGKDREEEAKQYFISRLAKRSEDLRKKREEKQKAAKKKREEDIIASISGFIKYLKSIKAKRVYKKEVTYYYQESTKLDITGYEVDFIIRHIAVNDLYDPKSI